jgi:acyl transferase domain-containing protein
LGWDEAEKFLTSGVIIACENSPKSVTLSGDVDKVNAVVASIQEAQPDILARVLKVDKAYHSHHMVEIGNAYHKLIADEIFGKEPTKPFFSSVTGQIQSQGTTPLSARYWQKNLESPVLFSTAVTALLKHEIANNAVFLEIGPHSGLAGPLRQIQTQNSNSAPYISTMLRNQDCVESFLSAIGKLYSVNVAVDLKKLIPSGTTLPDLPRYPWNHSETYWYESRLSKEWRHREHPYHDLLGVRIPESIGFEPVWRNMFHLENAPWIRDHKVKGDVVFPFAGYAGMVGEAVRQISGIQEAFTLRQVVVSTALVLSEAKPTEIMTSFRRHRLTDFLDSEWWEFTIFSHNGHMWLKHFTGQVRAQAESLGPGEVRALPPRKVASKRCYNSMERSGLNFGPTFRRLEEIRSETTRQVATAMAVNKEEDQVGYHLHPTQCSC